MEKYKTYQEECSNGKGDEWLAQELGSRYPSVEDNLSEPCIITQNANSSLNNKLFEGKREAVSKWAYDS